MGDKDKIRFELYANVVQIYIWLELYLITYQKISQTIF